MILKSLIALGELPEGLQKLCAFQNTKNFLKLSNT